MVAERDLAAAPAAPEPGRMRTVARAARLPLDIAVPAAMLVLIAAACFVGPAVSPLPPPVGGSPLEADLPLLSPGHLLGTDVNGNDILSRLAHGGRASLQIALAVNLVGLLVGGALGALAAEVGGATETLVMRSLDVLIAFPPLVLVLAVAQSLGQSLSNTVLALATLSVPAFARIARSATLRLREQPFMLAARFIGTGRGRTLILHVAPNIVPQLASFALLGMGTVIIIEGALSFLGLGIPLPSPSWGSMIAQGQHLLSTRPVLLLLPSSLLLVTVLSFTLLGEALRERWQAR